MSPSANVTFKGPEDLGKRRFIGSKLQLKNGTGRYTMRFPEQASRMNHMKATLIVLAALAPVSAFAAQGADFSPSDICKATIAVEMGRATKSMKTVKQDPPEISYRRDDGDSFKYRCKLDGDRVIWRTFLSDTMEWGRWREQSSWGDAMTTYEISGGKLTITNDQSGVETFKKSDF